MVRVVVRLAVAAVVTALVVTALVVTSDLVPSAAQAPAQDVEVTGTVTCDPSPGVQGWTITWSITNTTVVPDPTVTTPATLVGPPEPYAVALLFPSLSGVWTEPVPILPGFQLGAGRSVEVVSGPVPDGVAGEITLTVPWDGDLSEGVASATVAIAGSCAVVGPTDDRPPAGATPATAVYAG